MTMYLVKITNADNEEKFYAFKTFEGATRFVLEQFSKGCKSSDVLPIDDLDVINSIWKEMNTNAREMSEKSK